MLQGRVNGAIGVPVPEQIPGDCYVWGSMHSAAEDALPRSNVPVHLHGTNHLDIAEVQTPACKSPSRDSMRAPTAVCTLGNQNGNQEESLISSSTR